SYGSHVQIIDPLTGKDRQTLKTDSWVQKLAFSPDGKRLVTGGSGKSIETKLPDGRQNVSTEHKHPLAVWDVAAGTRVWGITVDGYWPLALAFGADGSRVATVPYLEGKSGLVRVWDATTGRDLGRIELPQLAGGLAFDRTGKRLAVS